MPHIEQRQRTVDLLKERGIDRALFANPHSVTWLTGVAVPIETGSNFFAAAPPFVWYEDGHFTLYIVDVWAGFAAEFAKDSDASVVTYLGYTIQQPIRQPDTLAPLLKATHNPVGVEVLDAPAFITTPLKGTNIAIDGWLEPLRMVKTAEELHKLRENFALADVGQAAAKHAVRAGVTEIDVWTAVERAVQTAAGRRVPMGNDCIVGTRQANIGGWPENYPIHTHDSVIVDISTIMNGYWSDGCATYVAGEPTNRQIEIHKRAAEALELGISLVKPGVKANAIDAALRAFMSNAGYAVYPHHSGHGVGVSGHELPRIVPYDETPLEPGMVIMLEPGIYFPGETGVRLEDAILVTSDGAEVLTKHDKSL